MEWRVIFGGSVLVRAMARTVSVVLAIVGVQPANVLAGECAASKALFVDIRGSADGVADASGIDARVPYAVRDNAGPDTLELRQDFRDNMDALLLARGARHDQAVILLAPSRPMGDMAAANLQEHGFSRVYVVSDGADASVHTARR